MKILKIYPKIDIPSRYNYQVNYGIWDTIHGDKIILENFKDLNILKDYDFIFLPMYKKWQNHIDLYNKIKSFNIKKILFDNDCYYRSFENSFYKDIDYIFYRCLDMNNKEPKTHSSWLPWSIDCDLYKPIYGGNGVLFNCSINYKYYNLRYKISKVIKNTNFINLDYIKKIQESGAAIHVVEHK